MTIPNEHSAKPFLKWAGGKTQLLTEIEKVIPYNSKQEFTYIEPFVGSGAMLFFMLGKFKNLKRIIINDLNTDLINCYTVIQKNVDALISILGVIEIEYLAFPEDSEQRKKYYYEKRSLFNSRCEDSVEQAALLIFLNKTCFNGLYRVNSKNEFNVPQGSYKKPQICHESNLKAVEKALQKVEIFNGDYKDTLQFSGSNSFFYFDPPYKPISLTSSFNAYAKSSFNDASQIELKLFCDSIAKKNSQWVLSNSDVKVTDPDNDFFDELYKDYTIQRVLAKRSINSKASHRGKLTEILVSHIR